MPTITNIQYDPRPAAIDHPIAIEVTMRTVTAGPVTIHLLLDDTLPYFFIQGGQRVRELTFTRTFGSPGDHVTHFSLSLITTSLPSQNPTLTVRAAGIDGSSMPFPMTLGVT